MDAIAGPLVIGQGGAGTVALGASNQIADSSDVSVFAGGAFDLNGFNEAIDDLNLTGGDVSTGAGTLTLDGTLTSSASDATATVSGNLSLPASATIAVNDADATAIYDLDIMPPRSPGPPTASPRPAPARSSSTRTTPSFTGNTTISAGVLRDHQLHRASSRST